MWSIRKMVIKAIEIIGTSEKSVTDAVQGALKEAAKNVKGIEWLKVTDYSLRLDEAGKVDQHQTKLKVYFEVRR